MDRVTVNPKLVRGLGDVVSPKSSNDFFDYNSITVSSTDSTYGTVYTDSYRAGAKLVLDNVRIISSGTESFSVSATLKDHSDAVISGATVHFVVNDSDTTVTTNGSGVASLTVSCDGSSVYRIKVYYIGNSNDGGCFANSSVSVVGSVDELELIASKNVIQTGDTSEFVATLLDGEGNGVPYQVVSFYEEWTPGIRLTGDKSIIQSGGTVDLSTQLYDTSDGSLVRESGHNITFYAPFYKNKTTSATTVNEDIGDEYIITTDNRINIGDGESGGIYLNVQEEDGILLRVVVAGQPSVLDVILDKPYISMNNGVLSYNDTSIDLTSYSSSIDWTNLYDVTGEVIVW